MPNEFDDEEEERCERQSEQRESQLGVGSEGHLRGDDYPDGSDGSCRENSKKRPKVNESQSACRGVVCRIQEGRCRCRLGVDDLSR